MNHDTYKIQLATKFWELDDASGLIRAMDFIGIACSDNMAGIHLN